MKKAFLRINQKENMGQRVELYTTNINSDATDKQLALKISVMSWKAIVQLIPDLKSGQKVHTVLWLMLLTSNRIIIIMIQYVAHRGLQMNWQSSIQETWALTNGITPALTKSMNEKKELRSGWNSMHDSKIIVINIWFIQCIITLTKRHALSA